MKIVILSALFTLLIAAPAQSLAQDYGLPTGALVIETQPIKSKARADRALLLWMLNPRKNPREAPDEPYTCPEETRGSYYSGPTRVSLVNTRTRRIINTVNIKPEYESADAFDIPYKIHGGYYHVPGVGAGQEGKPVIMQLRDYNGDGRAVEFALFDAQACMGLETALVGYSEPQDRVIQYPIKIEFIEGRKSLTETTHWADYLFSKKPLRPGYWRYEIDYSGRGGPLEKFEIRYNRRTENFEGRVTRISVE